MHPASKLALLVVLATTISLFFNYQSHSNSQENWQQFFSWSKGHGKTYSDESEAQYRYGIFLQNMKKITQHNKKAQNGQSTYFMGLNSFASLTEKQFKDMFNHFKFRDANSLNLSITTKCTGSIEDSPNPPKQVNWTQKAVDKNVIVEGSCAGNYAFSAVAALEGVVSIKLEKNIKLSDQQILDCSGDYGNQGCRGGFMDQAYWYMIDQGVASNQSYPYKGVNQNCKYSQAQKIVKVGRCARVPPTIYSKLISAVIQQPVTVAVSSQKFMLYERGIFDGDCNHQLDRGMLLVGYGADEEEHEYWILKNTLGVSWGERGYMRLKRTEEDGAGMCGIQLLASVPQNVE